MNPLENRPENSMNAEISTQTTRHPASLLQRAVWTLCLMIIGSVLAIHGALAYSPDLAKYVPDVLVKSSPATASTCSSHASMSVGCQARTISPADFAGCCSMRVLEQPLLTDGLYHEEETPRTQSTHAELPADALECLPETSETPELTEPQASVQFADPAVTTSVE